MQDATPPVFFDFTTNRKEVIADLILRLADSGRPTHVTMTKDGPQYTGTISVPADEGPEGPATS